MVEKRKNRGGMESKSVEERRRKVDEGVIKDATEEKKRNKTKKE
jgi:hypothetical protein